MKTLGIILLVILLFYTFVRNFLVLSFVMELNTKGYEICTKYLNSIPEDEYDDKARENLAILEETWESINAIPYWKYLFSFKPLKPEYWLNEKQLEFLQINKF